MLKQEYFIKLLEKKKINEVVKKDIISSGMFISQSVLASYIKHYKGANEYKQHAVLNPLHVSPPSPTNLIFFLSFSLGRAFTSVKENNFSDFMLDHQPIVSPGNISHSQNHKMVPVFLPTRTTSTMTADPDKDVYYKTELPPLPVPNGKKPYRGR